MIRDMSRIQMRETPIVLAAALALCCGCGDNGSSAAAANASLGCQSGDLSPGMSHIELDFGGVTRSYEIYAPPGYDGASPMLLVLNFHGYTSNGERQALNSRMNTTADERRFIVAYPNGIENSWNGGTCCGVAARDGIDDVAFTRAIIDDIGGRACIDTKRVFATGMSNGGFLSHRLACEAADVIAAVAPVAGVLGIDAADCKPSRPITVMHMHGIDDALAPYEDAPVAIATWVEKNGCTGEPSTEVIGSATCETTSDCTDGVSVTLCSIKNHGHCWPGQETCFFGEVSNDFPGNDVMLDLFESVTLP